MLTIPQRLQLAVQEHEAGRLDEAEALYRRILNEAPQEAHALHLLGVLAHQAGRYQEAIDLIHRALAAHGPHPVFHSNLAAVYLAAGLPVEAEGNCREALRLNPGLADAHYNLGVALRGKGQLDEAASAFREVLRFNPAHGDARRNLGSLPAQQGKRLEVLARLREMVRVDPSNAQARNDLGMLLLAGGQAGQAVQQLREAIRLQPAFAEAYTNLGVAQQTLNQSDEAMQCFREALRINPAYARARNNLGYALEVQGRIDEALAEFQQTLRLDPDNAQALFFLSELAAAGRYHFSDAEVRGIQELTARTDLPLDDQCRLHFALAQVLDKAGAYAEAFEHCRRGNNLRNEIDRRCGVVFDPAAERQRVDRLIATFTPAYFERVRSFGLDSELPIFIVGMLRSGTTLAEQILASHPQVFGAGELRDLGTLTSILPQRLGSADDYPECLARLDAATTQVLAESYLQRLRQLGGEAARVVDKAPINFLHLGVIATLFRNARIIHCRRDPMDTCLSCFFQNFADPLPYTQDLRHLGLYYREYERLMTHWAKVLPVPIFDLHYEELTADQEGTSRRLVAFAGLEWDERCLRFHKTPRVVRTASTLQVRQPMYRSSAGRWKHYEAHLQPLLEALKD